MIRIQTTGRTDVGKTRSRNEDSWAEDDELGLVAVADGMGGHPAGHIASRLAVETVLVELGRAGPAGGTPTTARESEDPGGRMARAVCAANRRILDDAEKHPERRGMGTTLTVLQIEPGDERYRVGHVGDSRAYLFRDGSLEPVTRDHTPLQQEVDAGRMTREEARLHPMSNVLAQALGTAPEVDPQVVKGDALPGDLFLLCSDGLTAVLPEERIRSLLDEGRDGPLDELAGALVEATLEGGAPDNVTVALARVEAAD